MAELGRADVDALQEVASIGCGQALTALGALVRRQLEMDVPEPCSGPSAGALAGSLGARGGELVAVAVRLEGLLAGRLVLALTDDDAERLAAALGQPLPAPRGWTPLAESALLETGNIVASAFVSAVARLVRAQLLPSVPVLARGAAAECFEALVPREASGVAVATRFRSSGPAAVEGLILVLPDAAGVAGLLEAIDATARAT